MGPRLILSNAKKSAGTHAPIFAGGVVGLRNKFGAVARGGRAALADIGLPKLLAPYPTFTPVKYIYPFFLVKRS